MAEEKKVIDSKFIVASSYLILASIYDTETTFAVIRNGGHECNPIMKPFVKNGRAATYAFQFGLDAIIIYASYEMKKSKKFEQVWWILPSFVATSHVVAGSLNMRYVW